MIRDEDGFIDTRFYPKERQTKRVSAKVFNGDPNNPVIENGVIIGRFDDRYKIKFDDGYEGVFHENELNFNSEKSDQNRQQKLDRLKKWNSPVDGKLDQGEINALEKIVQEKQKTIAPNSSAGRLQAMINDRALGTAGKSLNEKPWRG